MIEYRIGDVFDRMSELPDSSVDLVLTSPPFLALRSYLPADHPNKDKEIGSEATPAEFVDVLLRLTAEWRRLLTPHGSIAVELGDTYSGSTMTGGDDGGSERYPIGRSQAQINSHQPRVKDGWPLAKSLTLIPEAYRFALAYGINPHTGQQSPAGQWRIRNVIRWVRPNPPVGALGDKFRPATSELVVACVSKDRWFDLDAVRTPNARPDGNRFVTEQTKASLTKGNTSEIGDEMFNNPIGSPPLDWWKLSPGGYSGAHYAVWPPELCVKPIEAMCPREVCAECGEPRRRIVGRSVLNNGNLGEAIYERRRALGLSRADMVDWFEGYKNAASIKAQISNWELGKNIPTPQDWAALKTGLGLPDDFDVLIELPQSFVDYADVADYPSGITQDHTGRVYSRLPARKDRIPPEDWSDCGHDNYRPGTVLDPFAGTGTTLLVAHGHGRDAIGIDIDERNADLAEQRIGGLFLDVVR